MKILLSSIIFCCCLIGKIYATEDISPNVDNHEVIESHTNITGNDLDKLKALPENEKPIKVSVGVYLIGLDSFNYADSTFSATFWVWFVYDEKYYDIINPHKTFELVNFTTVDRVTEFKERQSGKAWAGVKIRGTFKYAWDLSKYPVDSQNLKLIFEESDRETDEIFYITDEINSGFPQNEIEIKGWTLSNFKITGFEKIHNTTYGNPSADAGDTTKYSTMIVDLNLKRSSSSTFLKLNIVVIVAFVISLLTLRIRILSGDYFGARVGCLVAMMYSVVLNIQYVDGVMGTVPTITLTDRLQIFTLAMILWFFLTAIIGLILTYKNKLETSVKIDKITFCIAPLVYILVVALIANDII